MFTKTFLFFILLQIAKSDMICFISKDIISVFVFLRPARCSPNEMGNSGRKKRAYA